MIPPDDLLAQARAAARSAYAPTSKFHVGAAVRAGGQVFTGCNIENSSLGLTMCAERVAIFKAVSSGAKRLEAVAVSCIDAAHDADGASRRPCGACLQVMAEFAADDLPVLIDGLGLTTLTGLLMHPFRFNPGPPGSS